MWYAQNYIQVRLESPVHIPNQTPRKAQIPTTTESCYLTAKMSSIPLTVDEWLEIIGMADYKAVFEEEGYDDLAVVSELTEEDLNILRITKPGTRKKLLLKAKVLRETLARG